MLYIIIIIIIIIKTKTGLHKYVVAGFLWGKAAQISLWEMFPTWTMEYTLHAHKQKKGEKKEYLSSNVGQNPPQFLSIFTDIGVSVPQFVQVMDHLQLEMKTSLFKNTI